MSKGLRSCRQRFMNAMPRTYITLSKFACRHVLYRRERRYLGGKLRAKSGKPSVLFLGGYRAASMFLEEAFVKLAADSGLSQINLAAYYVHTDRDQVESLTMVGRCEELFQPKGFFYGALRRPIPLRNVEDYNTIIVLRDLRDVLVSLYYSIVYAHTVIDKTYLNMKSRASEGDVDAYVLKNMGAFKERYVEILDWAEENNLKVERYEEMISDFGPWFRRVASALGIDQNKQLLEEIISQSSFDVATEDATAHKRGVKSGAHVEKLRPETKELLDRELGDVLRRMDYV